MCGSFSGWKLTRAIASQSKSRYLDVDWDSLKNLSESESTTKILQACDKKGWFLRVCPSSCLFRARTTCGRLCVLSLELFLVQKLAQSPWGTWVFSIKLFFTSKIGYWWSTRGRSVVAFGMRLVDLWSLYGRSVVGLAQGHFWGWVKGEAIVLSSAKKLNVFWTLAFKLRIRST